MYSTDPFRFWWSWEYIIMYCINHLHEIGSINLSQLCTFFPCLRWLYDIDCFISITRKFFVSIATVHSGRIRLLAHYTVSLSSLHRNAWEHWTYSILVKYILSKMANILTVNLYAIYRTVCFAADPFLFWWLCIVNDCTLVYHHKIGNLIH